MPKQSRVAAAVATEPGQILAFLEDGRVFEASVNRFGGVEKWQETLPVPGTTAAEESEE